MLYLDISQTGAKLYFIIIVWLSTLSKINVKETHPVNKSSCFNLFNYFTQWAISLINAK